MKGWDMIHKIKALHDGGQGLSIRAISMELGISRNTVRKYLRADEPTIQTAQSCRQRVRKLDDHREYIIHLLRTFPRLSSIKVARKLEDKVGKLAVSPRSLRRYVARLKETVVSKQPRRYQPVLDMVPGVQCQVDPGELRDVVIGGVERVVHFVVFVLSYARLMYVGVRFEPLDTEAFIQLHDEAFRYFGGMPEECVYDQTKLVVLSEKFREIEVNPRFARYATTAGFRLHACRGYDPESKGKVEAGVKYTKQDAFYGDTFRDETELRAHIRQWLDEVANQRIHGSTGQAPQVRYDAEERAHMKPYLTPTCLADATAVLARRKVDKTGLLSWKSNKYSVPMAYQQGQVGVHEHDGQLQALDLECHAVVATHAVCPDKGRTVRNNDHYRDPRLGIAELEQAVAQLLGHDVGRQLCDRLHASMPRYYKDQLVGARRALAAVAVLDRNQIAGWAVREGLTAGKLKQWLQAAGHAKARGRDNGDDTPDATPLDLSMYSHLGHSSGQPEVTHGAA